MRSYAVSPGTAVLGSDPSCDFVLPFPGVSRRHARCEHNGGAVLLADLGSKNGLCRAGRRLDTVELAPGETIRLGRAIVLLEEISTADNDLGAVLLARERPPLPDLDIETRSEPVGVDQGEVSPTAALTFVRDLERAAQLGCLDLAIQLARLRRFLNAVAVVRIATPPAGSIGIEQLSGEAPVESDLAAVLEIPAGGLERLRLPSGRAALVIRSYAGDAALLALMDASEAPVDPWRVDLFEHIAHRLWLPVPAVEQGRNPRALRGLTCPEELVIGHSPAMGKLMAALEPTANSRLDVLILGETGTGKELIARLIHASGPTAAGPFAAINCAAIPNELVEAELFGVEARVATGVDPRSGLFVKADGGSIFLDEIGDLPEALQAKLLRVLQEREVLPLGGTRPRRVQLRVISASNRPIPELVRDGSFRADLYFRLRGLQFHVPPLRERPEDIVPLALAFVERSAREHSKRIRGITQKALALLLAHDWPGNVRELKSELERAVLLTADGGAIESDSLAPVRWQIERAKSIEEASGAQPKKRKNGLEALDAEHSTLSERINEVEREAILDALRRSRGNQTEAARSLGITRNGLALKLKRLGL